MFHPLLHTTAASLPRRSCTASCTSAACTRSLAQPLLNPSQNLPFPFPRYAQLHRFLRERCLHNRLTEDQARWIFQQMIVGLDFCHRMVGWLFAYAAEVLLLCMKSLACKEAAAGSIARVGAQTVRLRTNGRCRASRQDATMLPLCRA